MNNIYSIKTYMDSEGRTIEMFTNIVDETIKYTMRVPILTPSGPSSGVFELEVTNINDAFAKFDEVFEECAEKVYRAMEKIKNKQNLVVANTVPDINPKLIV